jgi:arabinogalactan endo-1,4-beta-galactosidase
MMKRLKTFVSSIALTALAFSGEFACGADDTSRGADSGSSSGADGASSGAASDAGPDGGSGSSSGSSSGSGLDAAPDAVDAAADAADAGSPNPPFILGADITFTQQDQAGGATFSDNGTAMPILQLLQDHGFNYVRLRMFVDPTQHAPNPQGGSLPPYSSLGFGDLAHTVAFGAQIKAAGMGFLLDFHYSDTWADPGKQIKPAAWMNDDLPAAITHLHDYTLADIQALVAAGGRPDMVQIGNEITPGMLLSPGTPLGPSSTAGWPQLAQLLTAGINAVHEVDPSIQIMLHLDRGGDLGSSIAFINNALANGVAFDVFGESCYVAYQGGPSACKNTLNNLVTMFPNLKFIMAEYNADPADQTDNEPRQINDIIFNLPNHQGLGTFFWEPTRDINNANLGIFTVGSNVYSPIPSCITQYDQMRTDYGL